MPPLVSRPAIILQALLIVDIDILLFSPTHGSDCGDKIHSTYSMTNDNRMARFLPTCDEYVPTHTSIWAPVLILTLTGSMRWPWLQKALVMLSSRYVRRQRTN